MYKCVCNVCFLRMMPDLNTIHIKMFACLDVKEPNQYLCKHLYVVNCNQVVKNLKSHIRFAGSS